MTQFIILTVASALAASLITFAGYACITYLREAWDMDKRWFIFCLIMIICISVSTPVSVLRTMGLV